MHVPNNLCLNLILRLTNVGDVTTAEDVVATIDRCCPFERSIVVSIVFILRFFLGGGTI